MIYVASMHLSEKRLIKAIRSFRNYLEKSRPAGAKEQEGGGHELMMAVHHGGNAETTAESCAASAEWDKEGKATTSKARTWVRPEEALRSQASWKAGCC